MTPNKSMARKTHNPDVDRQLSVPKYVRTKFMKPERKPGPKRVVSWHERQEIVQRLVRPKRKTLKYDDRKRIEQHKRDERLEKWRKKIKQQQASGRIQELAVPTPMYAAPKTYYYLR